MEKPSALALTGATLYGAPDEPPLRDATVVLQDAIVANLGTRGSVPIPPGAKIVQCDGGAITAGFWNAHVHFHERKWGDAPAIPAPELDLQLQGLTRHGFASCFDLSSPLANTQALRARIESGDVRGPRLLTTGEGLIPTGGSPSVDVFRALGLAHTALHEVTDAAQAREAVRALVEEGVDAIKLFISAPAAGGLTIETVRAAVSEAHDARKKVFAHPNTAADVLVAVQGGVDVIAHTTPHSGQWDEALLERMRECGVALIPTLMLWDDLMRHDRLSVRERLATDAIAQLRAWRQLGGTILFGTDLGAVKYDPVQEYAMMAQAGMTSSQILASLTTLPAQFFGGVANAGTVRCGAAADLVVLQADPMEDVRNFSSVRFTIRSGRILYEASTSAASHAAPRTPLESP